MFEVVAEFPIFALILHLEAMPMHIGSSEPWLMFAGMIIRPRAISERTTSTGRFSRFATYSISPVMMPFRA